MILQSCLEPGLTHKTFDWRVPFPRMIGMPSATLHLSCLASSIQVSFSPPPVDPVARDAESEDRDALVIMLGVAAWSWPGLMPNASFASAKMKQIPGSAARQIGW